MGLIQSVESLSRIKTDLSPARRNSASRQTQTATSESPPCRYWTRTSTTTGASPLKYISLFLSTRSRTHVMLVRFLGRVLTHAASDTIFILRTLHGVAITILISHMGTLKLRALFSCSDLPMVTELGRHRSLQNQGRGAFYRLQTSL